MRHSRSGVSSFCLLSLLFVAASSGPACAGVCGDVNGDDEVLAGDALDVLRTAVGLPVALECPLEAELETCELDLDAYRPVECPCFHGPGTLNAIMQDNVTGTPTPLYLGGLCSHEDEGTLFYGLQSDISFPAPGVAGDGKCRVTMETVLNQADGTQAPLCTITRQIDNVDDDCDSIPPYSTVKHTNITVGEIVACKLQAEFAVGIASACAH